MNTKLDHKKTLKALYNPPAADFTLIDVPPLNFLRIDGAGDPNSAPEYKTAVEALYSVSFAIKFALKKAQGVDYTVMPLEGLWWADDYALFTTQRDKSRWRWTLMVMQPEMVTAELARAMIDEVRAKKKLPRAADLRFEAYHEGLSLQIMHNGSYDDETSTLARLHNEYIPHNGYTENGLHHEIYLNDPNRVTPEKLRTVLRQPVRKV